MHHSAMAHRFTIHIVDSDSRARADAARLAYSLGHHAEVYADLSELIQRPPREGIILVREDSDSCRAPALLADLSRAGVWQPLVVVSDAPEVEQVVAAIKAGALEISPRTVEIHRANMMGKLKANHAADAIRLKLDAQLEDAPKTRRPRP